jgi:soluble lytic murein transglycosylase-like protein
VSQPTFQESAAQWSLRFWRGLLAFGGDIGRGFVSISHHSFAMLGLLALILCMLALARPEVRTLTVQSVQGWLFTRLQISEADDEQQQVLLRSLAAPATDLTLLQLNLVQAVRNKYKIAPEPLNALMLEVFDLADRSALDVTLILAVIGVESNYNPFANSPTGAKGLMQVIPAVHSEQFNPYGGAMAIFDPKTNLRIGVKILKECINLTGSLEEGLRLYKAGEESVSQETEYISRVMAEQERLKQAIAKNPQDANGKASPNPSPKK